MTDFKPWFDLPAVDIDQPAHQQARERQQQLTKPAGSLGQLETIAIQLAGLQSTPRPQIDNVHISVFAADHGVMAENVSAFPQAVTAEMIRNFARGGAAINVLAREINATLDVINMGTVAELERLENVNDQRITAGTANFAVQAAMSEQQCQQAIIIGRDNADKAKKADAQLFIGGEMGIGNTTSATAIASGLLNIPSAQLTGPGTGLDKQGISHKAEVIQSALAKHQQQLTSPFAILQHLGGFEIAALTGSYLHCAKVGLPVLVDGFISSVAALLAEHMCPNSKDWFLYSHQSSEPGHQLVLQALQAKPILDLNMRLGEASGAAAAVPLIKLSCALHNQMATFAEAEVSEKPS